MICRSELRGLSLVEPLDLDTLTILTGGPLSAPFVAIVVVSMPPSVHKGAYYVHDIR